MPSAAVDQASLEILALSVGRPKLLARGNGEDVTSAIAKDCVTAPTLELDRINLTGDDQADRTVHGGPDKAVYLYPSEHWPWWRDEVGVDAGIGTFGENITSAGLTEDEVHLGDRFRWGEAVVEVSQPRAPCFKLALHLGRRDVLKAMTTSARTGWYLRVVEPGTVPTTGRLDRIAHDPQAPTIRHIFATTYRRDLDVDAARWILTYETLAEQWANGLVGRIERTWG